MAIQWFYGSCQRSILHKWTPYRHSISAGQTYYTKSKIAVYTQVVLHCGLTANSSQHWAYRFEKYNATSHTVGKNAMQCCNFLKEGFGIQSVREDCLIEGECHQHCSWYCTSYSHWYSTYKCMRILNAHMPFSLQK